MMRFVEFQNEHAAQLFDWFSNQAEITQWAGPGLNFDQGQEALLSQLLQNPSSAQISSFSVLSDQELVAFGQFYLRHGCAHLCRLAVSPARRGDGVIAQMVEQLLAKAHMQLSVSKASLLVYPDNLAAIRAYQKLGFSVVDYPGKDSIDGCLYMQKSIF